mmetsp:Transcript_127506/g.231876  ORF Transcript_127506/g.231876 Transcript_127506/m.231876 type:complete len:325 (-) Transcript_127506:58-1032(-)
MQCTEEIPEDCIPEEWEWPKEPFEEEELKKYITEATKSTLYEEYYSGVAESAPENANVYLNKQFASVFLNEESAGEESSSQSIDPNAYKAGRWYSFLNAKGDCRVYVHNYTKDITFIKPANFKEPQVAEKKSFVQLGTYIDELPSKIENIYCQQKSIPIILASQETCEELKTFFVYDKRGELCDTTKLKRLNAKALEDCRSAIVNAMKFGKWLCIYLGDHISDFKEKVCVFKNKKSFPSAVFRYGGLEAENVKEQIYTENDKESGQCVVRPGFKVCLVLMYDTMNFDMSSFGKEAMQRIPFLSDMEEVRTYTADDKKRFLTFSK